MVDYGIQVRETGCARNSVGAVTTVRLGEANVMLREREKRETEFEVWQELEGKGNWVEGGARRVQQEKKVMQRGPK